MTFKQKLKYLWLCRRAWRAFVREPIFTSRLFYARLMFLLTRRFCGPTLKSESNHDTIFNIQSLINHWAMFILNELGTSWHDDIRETVAPVIFDVGANIGQFGRLIKSINWGARIYAFEPWPAMFQYNEMQCHTFYHHACSDRARTLKLVKAANSRWTASTNEEFYSGPTIDVEAITLDSLIDTDFEDDSTIIDILKIDVDGAEAEVLNGAKELLKRVKYLILEVNIKNANFHIPYYFNLVEKVNGHDYIFKNRRLP